METAPDNVNADFTRVATYTRISTDEQRQPYSLEAQHERLRAYVTSQGGWRCVRAFTDRASGATTGRPGMQRMLAEARAGRFDLVLVYRVDRLARSVAGFAQIVGELDRLGVGFCSASEPFDSTTPAGRMMAQMLGVFAEFERASMIDRVVAGMERKAAGGAWCGGARPFGYKVDAEGALQVLPDEAAVVRRIFEAYVGERLGARAIANRLNDEGHRTKSDKPWSHTSVLTVLRNRVYIGEIPFRGAHHPGVHERLVEDEVFTAAQAILARRGSDHGARRSDSSSYLLSGLVRCAHCGGRFVGSSAKGNRYRYYVCYSRHRYGKDTCAAENLPADELDEAVGGALLETYDQPDRLRQAVVDARSRAGDKTREREGEMARLAQEITEINAAIDRYLDAFERGTMPEARCAPRVATLSERLGDLEGRHAQGLAELDLDDLVIPSEAELAALSPRVRDAFHGASRRERKNLLQAFVHEVVARDRAHIEPVFRVVMPDEWPESQVRIPSAAPPAVCG